jgi:hypothetical protein
MQYSETLWCTNIHFTTFTCYVYYYTHWKYSIIDTLYWNVSIEKQQKTQELGKGNKMLPHCLMILMLVF